jgi:hypothetical protein
MNSTILRWSTRVVLPLVFCGVLAVGCGSHKPKPVRWDVTLIKETPASIELDLVGVSSADKPAWENNIKVDDYWKNGAVRKGARKVTTTFENGKTWELKSTDPIWDTWLSYGATELMIIANLPGKHENGPYDRRRKFLPLQAGAYDTKDKTVRVEVQEENLQVLTPLKVVK